MYFAEPALPRTSSSLTQYYLSFLGKAVPNNQLTGSLSGPLDGKHWACTGSTHLGYYENDINKTKTYPLLDLRVVRDYNNKTLPLFDPHVARKIQQQEDVPDGIFSIHPGPQ
jgi:hypothetical protein